LLLFPRLFRYYFCSHRLYRIHTIQKAVASPAAKIVTAKIIDANSGPLKLLACDKYGLLFVPRGVPSCGKSKIGTAMGRLCMFSDDIVLKKRESSAFNLIP
jgi:hypothetical protein